MREEEKIFAGKLFSPGADTLREIKKKSHQLSQEYNLTFEDEIEKRSKILHELFGAFGEGSFIQGPMYIHYGTHTRIGRNFFANFHLTIQDDSYVTIGDNCNFGPGVSIVTPIHPLIAKERTGLEAKDGSTHHVCYAKSVSVGNDCWLGANVTICPGVSLGEGCVIGAGSVVTRDIPPHTLAAGVPCAVIREITSKDSVFLKMDILGEDF